MSERIVVGLVDRSVGCDCLTAAYMKQEEWYIDIGYMMVCVMWTAIGHIHLKISLENLSAHCDAPWK